MEDRRSGEVVAMLYNINRDAKKDPSGKTWVDVFPEHKEAPREHTDEEIMASLQMWAARVNKKLLA